MFCPQASKMRAPRCERRYACPIFVMKFLAEWEMFERARGLSLPRGEIDVITRTDGCRLLIVV